ncbi:CTP synthetase [Nioella ostreopsis]|uniref:CTP synthetase n=1 Tax=Nioella ostreopsis TaxID=2448479 RepID=UPI000FD76B13|nr:CTP synthetase [Nioella ostreopsis]
MSYLLLLLHLFIGATLAGVFLVILLVAGWAGVWPIAGAVVAGFLLAFPVAIYVARAMQGR